MNSRRLRLEQVPKCCMRCEQSSFHDTSHVGRVAKTNDVFLKCRQKTTMGILLCTVLRINQI